MESREFKYSLHTIYFCEPEDVFEKPINYFNFRTEEINVEGNFGLMVESDTYVDDNGYKSYKSKSLYIIPGDQAFSLEKLNNDIVAELIYQHLARQSATIYAMTKKIVNIPTLGWILPRVNLGQN